MSVLVAATVATWLITLGLVVRIFRGGGFFLTIRRLLVAAMFGGFAASLAGILILLHLFQAFSGETLVARVTTQRVSPIVFDLIYAPADVGEAAAKHIRLQGDQWSLSGGIVKWHPWMTALGLQSYHRPIRLSGQFSHLEQQRTHLPSVYPLAPAADRFWEAFYRADPYLPFVEAVYGSSAYAYVEPNVLQEVYVTPSGYLIKRKKPTSGPQAPQG